GGVETRGIVVPSRLGHRVGLGARRVPLPRRHAGDDPAHDGPEAGDVLVALAVTEAGAARLPVAAVPVGAGAVAVDAFVAAGSGAPAAAAVTVGRVAVHVVAGLAVAVVGPRARVLGPSPAGDHRTGRAGVDAGHRAAELGPPAVAALGASGAVVDGADDRRVGVSWLEYVRAGGGHQGGAHHGGPSKEASSAGARFEQPGTSLDQSFAHRAAFRSRGS